MKEITNEDLKDLTHKQKVIFALFCAKQVIHLTDLEEAKKAIEVTELWLEGRASSEDCRRAAYAVYATARTISAVYAADVDRAAVRAAFDADLNRNDIIKEQRDYLYNLKYLDDIFEEEVLAKY